MGLGILSVLTPTPAPPGGLCLRLQVLGRCLAAVAAAHAWLTGRAGRYLAAWALPQFLLLTQGDLQVRGHRGCRGLGGTQRGWIHSSCSLQVLKAEAEQLMLRVSETFPEPGDIHRDSSSEALPSLGSPWELQLCQQIRDVANNIQVWWDCGRAVLSTRMPVSPGVTLCHPVSSCVSCVPALLQGRAVDVLHQLQAALGRDLRPDDATGPALAARATRWWVLGLGGCGVLRGCFRGGH